LEVDGVGALAAGDAVRFTGADGDRVTAGEPSELLVWEIGRHPRRRPGKLTR
jgi:hypothetical protein